MTHDRKANGWHWAIPLFLLFGAIAIPALPAYPDMLLPSLGIEDLEYRGYAKAEGAFDIRDDLSDEDLVALHTSLFFEGKIHFSDRFGALLSTRGRYELYANGKTHTFKEIDLYEGYADLTFSRFDLRLGKQIVSWGRTDIISPVNNLNPRDMRGFFNPEIEDLRLPLLMGRLDYYIGDFTVEVIYIPFFEPSPFHLYGHDYAALKQIELIPPPTGLLETLVDHDIFPDIWSLSDLTPELWSRLEPALLATKWPRDNFAEGSEAGIRLTWSGQGLDLAASYLFTRSDLPTVTLDPGLIDFFTDGTLTLAEYLEVVEKINRGSSIYRSRYERIHIIGADLAASVGPVILNAEAACHLKRTYYQSEADKVRSPTFFYTLSLDYLWRGRYFLVGQFFHSIVLESVDRPLLFYDRHTTGLAAAFRASFLDEALRYEIVAICLLNRGDLILSPRVSYKVTDHLSISAGLNWFEGMGLGSGLNLIDIEHYTMIGHLDNNDQVFLSLKYFF